MNVLMLCVILGFLLQSFIKERSKFASNVLMALMYVLVCFSYDDYDYLSYTTLYRAIGYGFPVKYELLFVYLMKLGNLLGLDYDGFRMIVTVIPLLLINSTIRRYSKRPALVWACFIIFPGWIITILQRHLLALSVIIFGLRYLCEDKKGNTIKLFICIFIAALLHSSFWFFLVLLVAKKVPAKRILPVALIFVGLVYVFGSSNFLFKIFELLPINDFAVNKYMTGSYSNIIGIIYNMLRQIFVMSLGYYAVYLYRHNKNAPAFLTERQMAFMNMVPAVNNVFVFALSMLYYAPNANRMYHILAIVNIIACAISLSVCQRGSMHRFVLKWGLLGALLVLSVLAGTFESSVLFEYVLKMHFETNKLINIFGK